MMKQIQLTGKYKIEKGFILKDPLVTVLNANYNYESMTVVLNLKYENNQFSIIRDLDPIPIEKLDGLTIDEIETILSQDMIVRKTNKNLKQ